MFLALSDVMQWALPISLGLLIGYFIATRDKSGGDNIIYMEAEEFRSNMRKGQLIDVRTEEQYNESKILGSRNFPKRQLLQNLFKIRTDQAVFLYADTDRGTIRRVAKKLVKKGYKPIYILKGGFTNWPFIKK